MNLEFEPKRTNFGQLCVCRENIYLLDPSASATQCLPMDLEMSSFNPKQPQRAEEITSQVFLLDSSPAGVFRPHSRYSWGDLEDHPVQVPAHACERSKPVPQRHIYPPPPGTVTPPPPRAASCPSATAPGLAERCGDPQLILAAIRFANTALVVANS